MLQDLQWDGCRKETDYYEKSYGSRRNSNFRDTQVDIKDNRHSIGSKIQKYRKLKDMTQDELSKQSGIYLSTIKKYESGERNPKPDQLQKIAEALGISVTVFLDYDINTVSDVLSLVMKLNEQSSLKISADKDKDGNYIPSSIHMTFEDSQINEAICSYLNCKQQMDLISYEDNDKAVIEQQKEFYDDKINRLLLFNERIKKIR